MANESRDPDARGWWPDYVEEMKGEHSEQFLAGDLEGYRRGYTDGGENSEREKTDLTLAGLIIMAVIAGAVGFGIGLFVGV